MAFHHIFQVFQGINLNLSHTFARHTDIQTDLFKGLASIAMQTESPFNDRALFFAEFVKPVIENILDVLLLLL